MTSCGKTIERKDTTLYDIEDQREMARLEKLALQVFNRHWTQLDYVEQDDLYCFMQDMDYERMRG